VVDPFARSLVDWMIGRGFQVGLTGRKIDCPPLIKWAKQKLPDLDKALQLAGPHGTAAAAVLTLLVSSMTGGARTKVVADKLRPFGPHVDVLGLKVVSNRATLLPVLFADNIPIEDLSVYVETYAGLSSGLKDLVLHGFFAQIPVVDCEALFVYFDRTKSARG
jgi:hypothetical protein